MFRESNIEYSVWNKNESDSDFLYFYQRDTLSCWSSKSLKKTTLTITHGQTISAMDSLPDGQIAVASSDGSVSMLEFESGWASRKIYSTVVASYFVINHLNCVSDGDSNIHIVCCYKPLAGGEKPGILIMSDLKPGLVSFSTFILNTSTGLFGFCPPSSDQIMTHFGSYRDQNFTSVYYPLW